MDQKKIAKIISRLEKIESDQGVDVEHLLNLLKNGDRTLVKPLKDLSLKFGWESSNDKLHVPLATWTDVICFYFESGLSGLRELINKKDKTAEFALGVLEEIKTVESLSVLLNINDQFDLKNLSDLDIKFLQSYTNALSMISIKLDRKLINDKLYCTLIKTLKKIIQFSILSNNEIIRVNVVACMGRLGRLEEIEYLMNQKDFPEPYKDLKKAMIKCIRNAHR